jgi:hypothetical protein
MGTYPGYVTVITTPSLAYPPPDSTIRERRTSGSTERHGRAFRESAYRALIGQGGWAPDAAKRSVAPDATCVSFERVR